MYPKNATFKQMSALDKEYVRKCRIALKESRQERIVERANKASKTEAEVESKTNEGNECCCFDCLRIQPENKTEKKHWLKVEEKIGLINLSSS